MTVRRYRCDSGHSFTDYSGRGDKHSCPICYRAQQQTQGQQTYSEPVIVNSSIHTVTETPASSSSDSFSSGGGGDFGGGGSSGDY